MKRAVALTLALLMALSLCACEKKPPQTAAPGPADPDAAETESAHTGEDPAAGEDPIEALVSDEAAFLRAARRAVAQAFDRSWHDVPHDDWVIAEYYSGAEAQVTESALLQRARAVAAVTPDAGRLKREGENVMYLAALPQDGEWTDQWVELDLGEAAGVSKTVRERFVTARLEDDRVFLSFDDTEEANYYLRGWDAFGFDYAEGGRAYEMPGDELPVGPGHRYEVQGLFSHYKDLFVGNLSGPDGYAPYLFLVTEGNGLEMVDIRTCFQCGFFCAAPVPGCFDEASLSAWIPEDEYGQNTVIVKDSMGELCDLFYYAANVMYVAPSGAWSGSLGEVSANGGSWSRIANLDLRGLEYTGFSITELDMETLGGDADVTTLGMTEDGIVSVFKWNTWNGVAYGAMAWRTGPDESGDRSLETFSMKLLSGASPFGHKGETLTFYPAEFSGGYEGVDLFSGTWSDGVSGRCEMYIAWDEEDGEYDIMAAWADSASDTCLWTMTAEPVGDGMALYYRDSVCKLIEYGEYGDNTVKDILYENGSGSIMLSEPGLLLWHDDNDPHTYDCRFTPVNTEGW